MSHSPRPDRRCGARRIAGIRFVVGRREDHEALCGWMHWTPEARTAALAGATAEYFGHALPPPLRAVEREHGIPSGYLDNHFVKHRPAAALPEPVRLARCALDIRQNSAAAHHAARRWLVDSARAEGLAAEAANPLALHRLRRSAEHKA